MIKCPSCGAEIEDGSKFCGECGTAIPQSKECPQCHTQLAFGAKFCMECGYSFTGKQVGGVSIGDKNVIAGDVVAKKDTYHVSGNATIVKNEDESKKLVQCSICGKNMAISVSIKCRSCGEIVCEDCFDGNAQKCTKCVNASNDAASNEYRDAVQRILKEGRIGLADRKKLIAMQKKIGLSASRAMQIESDLRLGTDARVITENLKAFDNANRENAFEAFYRKGDYKKTTEILEPFFCEDTEDEELIAMYVGALSKYNPPAARKVIASLKADVVSAYMANFDMAMKNDDLASAERILDKAEGFWPNDYLVKCRRVVFLCAMGEISGDQELGEKAREVRKSLPSASSLIERSWEAYIDLLIEQRDDDETAVSDKCNSGALLLDIVSQGLDRQGAMYCIVDISGGESAKKYPVYYMNTESIRDWADEFKSRLLVLRKINAGMYTMGHGDAEVFDVNVDDDPYEPRNSNPKHDVLLSSPYYIAVFPVTNQQWWLMSGAPKKDDDEDDLNPLAPVSDLSYQQLRGSKIGMKWPLEDGLDSDSFLFKFREKTGIGTADLPTEAQWEVACRAGVDADFYTGKNIDKDVGITKESLSKIAVWGRNVGEKTVGTCLPNNWGLYDLLGNVSEWCRDPNFELHSDRLGHYHIYTGMAVDPTGCIYPLDEDDEIERRYRCVRGGLYWCEDPDKVTVWYRGRETPSRGNAGFRPVFTIRDEGAIKKMHLRDDDFTSLTPDEKKKLQKFSSIGDYSARYLLARSVEVETGNADSVRREYEELAKMGFPAALRAMGRLCAIRNTVSEKKLSIEYYKRAADLGDEESLCCYKALADSDERMRCSVSAILDRYVGAFEKGRNVKCFGGSSAAENAERFRTVISTALGCPKDVISKEIYAAMVWSEDDVDEPGSANFDVIASDGIYVIQPWNRSKISGYISWLDIRNNASLKVVGQAKDVRYLEFCKGVNILEAIANPENEDDQDALVSKALIAFYADLRNVVNDLYAETGIKKQVCVSDFSKLSPAEFKSKIADVSDCDALAHLSIARCFRDGVCTEVDTYQAIAHFRLACRGGAVEALAEYRRISRLDEYDRYVLQTAVSNAAVRSGMSLRNYWIGDDIPEELKARFVEGCNESALAPIDDKVQLFAAFSSGLHYSCAICFADDGVYVFNGLKNDKSGDGYITWPDFICECVSDENRDGIIVQKGMRIAIKRYLGDDYKKSLMTAINAIVQSVREIYSESFLEKVHWLRSFNRGKKPISELSTTDIDSLNLLLKSGCGAAGEVLYRYYNQHNSANDFENGIKSLKLACASGYPLVREVYREAAALDDSMKGCVCIAICNAAKEDAKYVIRGDGISSSLIDAFKRRATAAKLLGSKYFEPFACIGRHLENGQGMFFAKDGIYCIDEDQGKDDYFIVWADAIDGAREEPDRTYNVQIGNSNSRIVFNANNCKFSSDDLSKIIGAAVAAYKRSFSEPWQQAKLIQNKIKSGNLKIENLSSDDLDTLYSALSSGFGNVGEILRDYYLSKNDPRKAIVAYQKAIWCGVGDVNELMGIAAKGNGKLCTAVFDACQNYHKEDSDSIDLASSVGDSGIKAICSGIAEWMPEFTWAGKDSLIAIVDRSSWSNSHTGKRWAYGMLICREGLVVSNKDSANSGVLIWDAFAANPQPRLIEEDGENRILFNAEPKIQYDCRGDLNAKSALAFFTKLQIIAKRECCSQTPNGDDSFNVQNVCSQHKLAISISKKCLGVGASKFDDNEDAIDDLEGADYDDVEDHSVHILLPLLDQNIISVFVTNAQGEKIEQKFTLAVNDKKSGIRYKLDTSFQAFCSLEDERTCEGREICICEEQRFEQLFCLGDSASIEIEGVFNPQKLVVRYVSVVVADGSSENLITGVTYDGEDYDVEPFGQSTGRQGKVWVENKEGRSPAQATLSDDGGDDEDCCADNSDANENESCGKNDPAETTVEGSIRESSEEVVVKHKGAFLSFVVSVLPLVTLGHAVCMQYMAGDLFGSVVLGAPVIVAMLMYWCGAVHFLSLYLLHTILVLVSCAYGYQCNNWNYSAIVGWVGLGALIQNGVWPRRVFHSIALYLVTLAAGGLYLCGHWGIGTAIVASECVAISLLKERKNTWTWWRWALYALIVSGGVVACFLNHEFWGGLAIICAGLVVIDKE